MLPDVCRGYSLNYYGNEHGMVFILVFVHTH